jgi:multiple sugar transport system substrate-binding protein
MRARAFVFAIAIVLAPPGARAADLVIWWEMGLYPEEEPAAQELVAAFEQKTGKQVELTFHPALDLPDMTAAAVDTGNPPDFVFSQQATHYFVRWAYEGRLVDLADAVGHFSNLFDRDTLERVTLLDGTTGKRALYLLPMGLDTNHVHVWRDLLGRAGFTLGDIPREWEAFWSFWCDQVQPAARKAMGRDDLWGVGLPMSASPSDTEQQIMQFVHAYEADYVTRDGRLAIDEPAVRMALVKALGSYTALHQKGCTPPDALTWDGISNNTAFLARRVVMTANASLSIPGALRTSRREDYENNTATIEWPTGAYGQPLPINTRLDGAVVFNGDGHVAAAKEFVSFLVGEGWLAHWLDFAGDRFLPPMPALLEQPFWLNPGDRHRMAAAIQFLTRPRDYDYVAVSGDWRHARVREELVWSKAVHRVAADGISPEQAVDEAIARIKQILAE